jgi:hypothetical protein
MNEAEIKRRVRERDGFRCTSCAMTDAEHVRRYGRSLDVHRVVPGSIYSTEPGACLTLCKPCHGPQPRRQRGQPDLSRSDSPYHFWLDGIISEALDSYLASLKPQPTTTAVLELFIEECLQRRGYLPPPTA